MAKQPSTTGDAYTERLVTLSYKRWKSLLDVQRLYRWNLLRWKPGRTLDIGCGIGRYLKYLPEGSVGLDHNAHSINYLKKLGLTGFTPAAFKKSSYNKRASFDSLLLSHVLEHMTPDEGVKLIEEYAQLIKKGGKIIVFCPQEKGYASDATHITFLDVTALQNIIQKAGFTPTRAYSFPFLRPTGRIFIYNEFTILGTKN